MSEFYTWAAASRVLVSILLALCVTAQTLAALFSFYRRPHSRARIFENLLELFILQQLLVLSMLHGQAQNSHYLGMITSNGYDTPLYVAAGAVILLSGIVIAHNKSALPLIITAVSCLTLPAAETVFGGAYIWIYITALLFWLIRGAHMSVLWYRDIRTNISALSVKNAVDSLRTGVLFSEPDGFILLVNAQMHRLMTTLTDRVHRNSADFYDALMSGALSPGCRKIEYKGHTVCLLPDETAWMFTRTELRIKSRPYIQLSAADITQRWALTAQLQRQEQQLLLRREELKETVGRLQILSEEKELQNARLRTHDILNQRLVSLIGAARGGQEPDYDLLRAQSRSLLDDLKSRQSAASPRDKIEILRQGCKTIGVTISLDGELPENDIDGYIFADIVREGTANAVRHGFATEVYVRLSCSDGVRHLEISDNGRPPSGPVTEGSGIEGMRGKLAQRGGSLLVAAHPRFILNAELPDCKEGGAP